MTEMPIKMTKTTNKPQTSFSNYKGLGNSLAVQWLGLHTSTTGGMGLLPDQKTKLPHAGMLAWPNNNNNPHNDLHWKVKILPLLCPEPSTALTSELE